MTSYSQGGEDLAISLAFGVLGIPCGSYLDIGAYHPARMSNTYLFYTRGARGVLVEPNPEMCELLRRDRPGDVVVEAGVAALGDENATYFEFPEPSHNAFTSPHPLGSHRSVPLVAVNTLLAGHFPDRAPDFLSVDAEGMDPYIVRALDFTRWRPPVLCVELACQGAKWDHDLVRYLISRDYALRGGSIFNGIFVSREALGDEPCIPC